VNQAWSIFNREWNTYSLHPPSRPTKML